MLLFSNENGLLEVLSVLSLQFHQIGDFLPQLSSSGEQQVLEEVISSVNVDGSVLDVLFQLGDHGIMLTCSLVEVKLQLFQANLEVVKQFFNSLKELLDWSRGHGVELDEVKQGGSVGALGKLRDKLAGA
jgi:hypothetical protein